MSVLAVIQAISAIWSVPDEKTHRAQGGQHEDLTTFFSCIHSRHLPFHPNRILDSSLIHPASILFIVGTATCSQRQPCVGVDSNPIRGSRVGAVIRRVASLLFPICFSSTPRPPGSFAIIRCSSIGSVSCACYLYPANGSSFTLHQREHYYSNFSLFVCPLIPHPTDVIATRLFTLLCLLFASPEHLLPIRPCSH